MAIYAGTSGNDYHVGTTGSDLIEGHDGNDTLLGGSGADTIRGGAGADQISGDIGNDQLSGGDGNDSINGGIDHDFIYGDAGNDTLNGESGNDLLDGGSGSDSLNGGDGNDTLFHSIGAGFDTLVGGAGTDTLTLQLTSDQLTAAVRSDFVALQAWMARPLGTLVLANIGMSVTGIEALNILLDGSNVDIADLANAPPFAATTVHVATQEDEPLQGQLTASDPEGGALTWQVLLGPVNGTLQLDSATGAFTYDPADDRSGPDSFTVRITDAAGLAVDQRVEIDVQAVADAPLLAAGTVTVATAIQAAGSEDDDVLSGGVGNDAVAGNGGNDIIIGDDASLVRDIPLDIAATLTDLDGSETLTVRISGLPQDAMLSAGERNDDGSWTVADTDLVGLTLSTAATGNLVLAIEAIATEANGDTASTTAELVVTFASAGGHDTLDGGAGNDVIYGDGGNDRIDGGTGNDALFGDGGDDTMTAALDGGMDSMTGGSGTDTMRLFLSAADLTTDVRADLLALDAWMQARLAAAGSLAALAADSDGEALELTALGLTVATIEHLEVIVDGSAIDIASLANQAPVAEPVARIATDEDVAVSGQLQASDADGDTLSWSLVDGPSHGVLTLQADGRYTYLADANFSGADAFTVRVADPDGASAEQRIEVAIAAVADAPTLQVAVRAPQPQVAGPAAKALAEDGGAQATLRGSSGNDTLTGSGGNDLIKAYAGHDLIHGDGGAAPSGGKGSVDIDIAAALQDADGSEMLTIIVAGLPDGAELSAGARQGDGSYLLAPDQLDGLTLTASSGATFTLAITAVATEQTGEQASVVRTLTVAVPQAQALPTAGAGNDTIFAGQGNDTVHGGGGDDRIHGREGNDVLHDGEGADWVFGGWGDDVIYNGAGDDFVRGGKGNDVIHDGAGNDHIRGGEGNDRIVAGAGNDQYFGGSGFDTLDLSKATKGLAIDLAKHTVVGFGTDHVRGFEKVIGSSFDDSYIGRHCADVFDGGAGDDRIRGGSGADVLSGGEGRDTFVWGKGDLGKWNGKWVDTITDFTSDDRLDFSGLLKSTAGKALGSLVSATDNDWGTSVSVRLEHKWVEVARLEGFHAASSAQMSELILL